MSRLLGIVLAVTLLLGGLAVPNVAADQSTGDYKVRWIRNQIPVFNIPTYRGDRYEDMVPDTLDIQQRINLGVNGLTGPTDPEKDYMLYFGVHLMSNPPKMRHGNSDICQTKFMESLPLMRLAGGSSLNDNVDRVWMRTALAMIGPDGLAYWPSLPWAPDVTSWNRPYIPGADHYSMPTFCGRLLGAMTVYMQRDPSGPWKEEGRKIVDGLRSVAIDKGDYAYFPYGGFAPGRPRVREAEMPVGIVSSLVGWTTQGLAQYYRATGYEPARELAGKLARYLIYHGKYYGPNGEFLPNNTGYEDRLEEMAKLTIPGMSTRIHFQHHTVPLLGMLDYALATGDGDVSEFVRKSFEWAKKQGIDLVGYFPENIGDPNEMEAAETCQLAGMIGLALKLSAAGMGDYWDDADRWMRNQFAENQLTQCDWMYHMAEGGLTALWTSVEKAAVNPIVETVDRVPERNIGTFAGWPTANDWYVGHGGGIMHCCTGNGTRALYYIWENMLTHSDGVLSVNLLLNRPSPWADVYSHIPYTGQVDVKVKKDCAALRVRIPQWVKPEEVVCTVNGKKKSLGWDGRYALVGSVKTKDAVTLTFPISERKLDIDIQKQHYHMTLKGNEVVDIYPRGRFCPLYQRNHYRQNDTLWRNVTRFVSDESMIDW
ncbi:MAG: hypothetical protein A2Z18_08570 [Armatimonadetes bacterium RBG_16_58_9]|nr:MAG: hypothetical protein A2Z18_08570 [Armatimonadetes bacterium RBG_16_58_9]